MFRSQKLEWLPATGYISLREEKRDTSYYLMNYYNWLRPNKHNDEMPPAKAEVRPNQVSGLVDHYNVAPLSIYPIRHSHKHGACNKTSRLMH